MGNLIYKSPEQIKDMEWRKFKSDLWAFKNQILRPVVYERLRQNPNAFRDFFSSPHWLHLIRDEDNTPEFQIAMAKKSTSLALKFQYLYPETIKTLFSEFYTNNRELPSVLERITDTSKREEVLEFVLSKNVYLIRDPHLRHLFREEKFYIIAVKRDVGLFASIPDRYRTVNVALASLKTGKALQWIPDEICTEEMCLMAIEKSSSALRWVPERFKTKELCELAVQKGFSSLKYVPEELQTPQMKMRALMKSNSAKKYIKGKK